MRHDPASLMLFAAGFGTRMGALTATRPKPLIEVAGRALIDHALALADAEAIGRKVVNLHYLGDMIAAHLAQRPDILLSREEDEILDTGGGLRAALPLLGPGPVFTLNTDAVWTGPNPLRTLRENWRDDMGALLLLAPADRVQGRTGPGDFALDGARRITRGGPYVYLGAQIVNPAGLETFGPGAFSLNRHWDVLIAAGRAHGCLHSGGWCDVGHPDGIAIAEAMLREAAHG